MAITVQAPARIGPGYMVHWTGATAPVPIDDVFSLLIRETFFANPLTSAIKKMNTFASFYVMVGTSDLQSLGFGMDRYVAPGAAVQLEWSQDHANGVNVASGTITGLLWDPTGGLGPLITQLTGSGLNTAQAILNAVRYNFPATT